MHTSAAPVASGLQYAAARRSASTTSASNVSPPSGAAQRANENVAALAGAFLLLTVGGELTSTEMRVVWPRHTPCA